MGRPVLGGGFTVGGICKRRKVRACTTSGGRGRADMRGNRVSTMVGSELKPSFFFLSFWEYKKCPGPLSLLINGTMYALVFPSYARHHKSTNPFFDFLVV